MFPQLRSFPKHIIGVKNGEGGEWRAVPGEDDNYVYAIALL